MTLKEAKGNFFDREKVIAAVGKANAQVAKKQGGMVRTIMQRSMRRRKKPAPPGQPPNSHEGQLREQLYFAFDFATQTSVVGPVKLGNGKAPEIQDKGGFVPVWGIYNRRGEFVPIQRLTYKGQLGAKAKGKLVQKMVEVKARPFSMPALETAKDKLADQWKGEVKGG